MSKLNKLVTNYPVSLSEEEIENLSATLAPVVAACGGGGGGTGGKIYTGIGFVTVNNSTNQIGLTEAANTKLNQDIPTKVSDLSDSANYQTVAGMNEYLTTAEASTTYQTIEDMSAYYKKTETSSKSELDDEFSKYATVNQLVGEISNVTQTIDILQGTVDGKQDILTFGYDENDAISSINSHKLAGAGGVTGDYYSASNPSGFINSTQAETQILEKHYLTEASGDLLYVPIPQGLSDGQYYAMTTSSWKVIQGAGDVSGISTVAHDDTLTGNGNNENLGVDITKIQTKLTDAQIQNITDVTTLKTASAGWDAKVDQSDLNDYLTKTQYGTDSATFALKTQLDEYATKEYANNASANALSEAETWVENKHYLTEVPNTYALKTDIPTTVAQLTDSGNYYTKSETSGNSELSTEFAKYQPKGNYLVADDITGKLDKSIYANASGNWENTYNVVNQYSAAGTWLTAHQSLTNYYQKTETSSNTEITNALNTKVDKPTSTQTGKLVYDGDTSAWVSMPAGTTIMVEGANGISAEYDNVNTYTVGLSASYKEQIEAVSSKLTKASADTLYSPISVTGDVNTLKSSSADWNKVSAKLDSSAFSDVSGTFLTKSSADNDYAPKSVTGTVNTLTAASAGWNNKVDKPTSLNDKYLVLRTDSNGAVSGWEDLKKECYSKTEATGTFVATANIDTTTLSGDGKTVSTKLGVKTDVIATRDYVNSSFLPLSGGTVSGELVVSAATGTFDNSYVKCVNNGNDGYARFGVGSYGGAVIKAVNGNNNVQVNVKYNTNNNELIQVQKSNTDIGFLIPAQIHQGSYTPTSADGILHIVLES